MRHQSTRTSAWLTTPSTRPGPELGLLLKIDPQLIFIIITGMLFGVSAFKFIMIIDQEFILYNGRLIMRTGRMKVRGITCRTDEGTRYYL